MTRSTPTIRDARLHFSTKEQSASIVVGSEQWFAWLGEETSTIFSFHALDSSVYTARKERAGSRRGGWYWKAYRTYKGRLYRAYLGRSEDLTLMRLNEAALMLTERAHGKEQESAEITAISPKLSDVSLLTTKLHSPRLPSALVPRERLVALLDSGQHRFTLLHAPAGFGKTTLVAQWLAYRQVPTAWLSLDGGDNDSVRFWSAVIAACQRLHHSVGREALELLSQVSFMASPLETALTSLLNDLDQFVREGTLILEDYHCVEQQRIHETLTFFIEHLPASLHVVMLTRSIPPLPLARWRVRGDVLEVGRSQLSFSAEETATFCQQMIPQPLAEEAICSLHIHLEGWAAGLRLLALSLQSQITPQAIEEMLTRLHAGFASDRIHQPIQEFFLGEILALQPEPLQLFLLQTGMLGRVTASLCEAVTGRQDSAEWLALVERSGFFLEALSSRGEWYRYHALFAEAMRAEAKRRLGAEALHNIALRAARWYEEHDMLVESIEAFLSAREFERAADLIARLHSRAYFSEHHTIRRWLEQFPRPLLHTYPNLCFRYAQARLFPEVMNSAALQLEQVEDLLQMAEAGWRRQNDLASVGMLNGLRASYLLLQGHVSPAVMYARQALELLPLTAEQPDNYMHVRHDWRCICLCGLALDAMQTGAFDRARQTLLKAHALATDSKDNVFRPIINRMLGEVCLEAGQLHQASEYYEQVLAEAHKTEGGEEVVVPLTLYGQARLAYEWNELERAEQLMSEAASFAVKGYFPHWEEELHVRGELLNLLLLRARGEADLVQSRFTALLARVRASAYLNIRQLLPDVLIWQGRLQISDGDLATVKRILDKLAHPELELSPLQQQTCSLLRAHLLLARDEVETALSLLEQLLSVAQKGQHHIRFLEIQLLITLAYMACRKRQQAQQHLIQVLSQARTEGFMRLFLDEGEPVAALLRSLLPTLTEKPLRVYAQRILHAFSSSATDQRWGEGPLIEPLSMQEQRVLALLVAGCSNPEIAEALVVSVNTVKGHVKNLYRKLGVANRVQAGEVARHAHLI
jgi:LuxR family transcriptional regulator, maltose regulon positive regulatory protein